jgi:hypothetical protein
LSRRLTTAIPVRPIAINVTTVAIAPIWSVAVRRNYCHYTIIT